MEDAVFRYIFRHLKNKGYAVYSPAQKTTECTFEYVVVKDAGTSSLAVVSSTMTLFDIMCYVPKDKYSTLEGLVDRVKKDMDGLFPRVRPTHFETPSFYDDLVKGHMISVQYKVYKKKVRA